MVQFLEHALVDVLYTLMKVVVKPKVLDHANSSLKLSKFDLSNSKNLLPCELMKLGTATKSSLRSAILLYWSKGFRNVAHLNIKLHVAHPHSPLVTWYLTSRNVSTILTGYLISCVIWIKSLQSMPMKQKGIFSASFLCPERIQRCIFKLYLMDRLL